MEIIKISSLACPSCIIIKKVINQIKEKYNKIKVTELDYDFDDVNKYNPGKILPVFIFIKDNKEVIRIIGEKKIKDFEEIIKKYYEKNI